MIPTGISRRPPRWSRDGSGVLEANIVVPNTVRVAVWWTGTIPRRPVRRKEKRGAAHIGREPHPVLRR